MARWKKIDSAPKDGRHVILAITDGGPGGGYVAEGYYEQDGDLGWFAASTHHTDYVSGQLFPSHWQPLPVPPRTSAAQ